MYRSDLSFVIRKTPLFHRHNKSQFWKPIPSFSAAASTPTTSTRRLGTKSSYEDPEYYDYYDVGAMRLPLIETNIRLSGYQTWSLISSTPMQLIKSCKMTSWGRTVFFNVFDVKGVVHESGCSIDVHRKALCSKGKGVL